MFASERPAETPTDPAWRRVVSRERAPWLAAGLLGVLLVLSWVGFAVDSWRHSGQVMRGVKVGDTRVAGRSPAQLPRLMEAVDRDYSTTKVNVKIEEESSDDDGVADDVDGAGSFTIDAGEIGLRVDRDKTAQQALRVGRTGNVVSRWWSWVAVLGRGRQAPVSISVDREAVAKVASERSRDGDKPAVEATIALNKQGRFVGVAGKPGRGIDSDRLARDLLDAANRGTPIKVTARYGQVRPRFTEDDADRMAERAEALVARPLPLVAEGVTGTISIGTLRAMLSAVPGPTALELDVDEADAADAAFTALAKAGTAPKEPTFTVNAAGGVDITPGNAGRSCCGPEAGDLVAGAVLSRPAEPLQLQLVEKQPKLSLEQAQALGVKERVAEFTTRHAAGQPRVKNIHRIADLIRGQVIPPGQSLSVNSFVGRRTIEKGFVVDKVIEEGKFAEDVGGGISQFATTLFNAAWFGGMEFGEYQSHSLYISRYPFGREATLGFPHPDLVIKNPSPYGVMLWPTYTNTTITVVLFSTKWVSEVKPLGQEKVPAGSCTKVITTRQRTFVDGRVARDTTRAQYRANEGQDCIDDEPPDATSTTVTRPGATTTTKKPGPSTTTGSTSTTKKPSSTTTTTG